MSPMHCLCSFTLDLSAAWISIKALCIIRLLENSALIFFLTSGKLSFLLNDFFFCRKCLLSLKSHFISEKRKPEVTAF